MTEEERWEEDLQFAQDKWDQEEADIQAAFQHAEDMGIEYPSWSSGH